jgi:hypothetical protein
MARGYYWDNTAIQDFPLTHLNGPGCRGEGAVATLRPGTATQSLISGVAYSCANEAAEPG